MLQIGAYEQITEFTNKDAGTSVWCKAKKNGDIFFVKKFLKPVRPPSASDMSAEKYNRLVRHFDQALAEKKKLYQTIANTDQSGILVVPGEVLAHSNHICTVAECVTGNVPPEKICSLTDWQKLVILRTLTMAIWNLHKSGIVHSDLKPSNILFTQSSGESSCKMRLIDFDSSFYKSTPPRTDEEIGGDLAYFAPEVIKKSCGEDVTLDERVDIYALGLIFHYLWCGKLPIRSSSKTVSECLLTGENVTLDNSIPLVLRKTIEQMIDVQPEKRLTTPVIYEILGIQLKKYPVSFKKLVL